MINYLEDYDAEVSETSILTAEEDKKVLQTKSPTALPPRPSENTKKPALYNFDPKSFLKNMETTTSYTDSRAGNTSVGYKPLPSFTPALNYSRGGVKSSAPVSLKRSGSYTRLHSDMSMYTNIGDDYKRTDDYNKFSKEFETEFGNDQREIERIHGELIGKGKKLEEFIRKLQESDVNMILFRSYAAREIEDIGNDLKEAYNHILVLMGDRSRMKEQFCIFKMKIKKLKSFIKTFQEDIQT
jgi:hypothetical protein